jgi:hypothetical protein
MDRRFSGPDVFLLNLKNQKKIKKPGRIFQRPGFSCDHPRGAIAWTVSAGTKKA